MPLLHRRRMPCQLERGRETSAGKDQLPRLPSHRPPRGRQVQSPYRRGIRPAPESRLNRTGAVGNVSSDGYSTLSDNDNFSPNDVLSPLSTCSSTLSSPNFIYNQNRSPNSFSNCRGAEEQIFWPQQTFDPNEYLEVQYTPEQSSTQLSSHTTQALYHSISYDIPMAYNSTDFAFPHQH